ncbi:MAG: hypothetical protein ACE14M_05500 [Terriglobales bacterium]
MAKKSTLYGAMTLVLLGAMGFGAYRLIRSRDEMVCGICERHINAQAGVIAEIGNRRRHVCCAHCAVTEGLQEHKPVRLIEVTDYNSGRKLDPARAWYVDGSRIVACTHDMTHTNEMKQVQRTTFDRCSPGTFAFASRAEAEAFAAKNGGAIRSLSEMLAAVNAGEVHQ